MPIQRSRSQRFLPCPLCLTAVANVFTGPSLKGRTAVSGVIDTPVFCSTQPMQALANGWSPVGAKRKTPEHFVGARPVALGNYAVRVRKNFVTTQAPTKHSGVRSSTAGCHTDRCNFIRLPTIVNSVMIIMRFVLLFVDNDVNPTPRRVFFASLPSSQRLHQNPPAASHVL